MQGSNHCPGDPVAFVASEGFVVCRPQSDLSRRVVRPVFAARWTSKRQNPAEEGPNLETKHLRVLEGRCRLLVVGLQEQADERVLGCCFPLAAGTRSGGMMGSDRDRTSKRETQGRELAVCDAVAKSWMVAYVNVRLLLAETRDLFFALPFQEHHFLPGEPHHRIYTLGTTTTSKLQSAAVGSLSSTTSHVYVRGQMIWWLNCIFHSNATIESKNHNLNSAFAHGHRSKLHITTPELLAIRCLLSV